MLAYYNSLKDRFAVSADIRNESQEAPSSVRRLYNALRELRQEQARLEAACPVQWRPLPQNVRENFPGYDLRKKFSFADVIIAKCLEAGFPITDSVGVSRFHPDGQTNYGRTYSAIWTLARAADDSEVSFRLALRNKDNQDLLVVLGQVAKFVSAVDLIKVMKPEQLGPEYYLEYPVPSERRIGYY